ncbi:MAG TPA: hypothetical protein VNY36_00920 [Bacteroidia bacterium]|jgi:hypothetical protein|nr:hypothetical protein [Bacteroidia bacterium]
MNHLKIKITTFLIALSFTGFAQKDSSDAVHTSIKGKFFISAGVGASIILDEIYGFGAGQAQGHPVGVSQSPVYNSTVDYGIGKRIIIGAGIAYQTAIGTDYDNIYTDNLTRLNISLRVLWVFQSTKTIQWYLGLRGGISYWTDVISPAPGANFCSSTNS